MSQHTAKSSQQSSQINSYAHHLTLGEEALPPDVGWDGHGRSAAGREGRHGPGRGEAALLNAKVRGLLGALLRGRTELVGSAEGKHPLKIDSSLTCMLTSVNTMSTVKGNIICEQGRYTASLQNPGLTPLENKTHSFNMK